MCNPQTERMLLNEFNSEGKVVDCRNIWFVSNNPTEERFLFLDLGEIDYEDGFYPTLSLAQTKKIIEILQKHIDYYEYIRKN
ncbi:MAG: hypothetical protein II309_01195 [Bacilli bacterium]|nr:hypothetical protein [Bacilli bacterium]